MVPDCGSTLPHSPVRRSCSRPLNLESLLEPPCSGGVVWATGRQRTCRVHPGLSPSPCLLQCLSLRCSVFMAEGCKQWFSTALPVLAAAAICQSAYRELPSFDSGFTNDSHLSSSHVLWVSDPHSILTILFRCAREEDGASSQFWLCFSTLALLQAWPWQHIQAPAPSDSEHTPHPPARPHVFRVKKPPNLPGFRNG